MLLEAGLALAAVPDPRAGERAYHTARPCTAITNDCLRTVQATVRGTVIRERTKSSEYTLSLTGQCGGTTRLR